MPNQNPPLFCIDMGTTRTRVWLTDRDKMYAHRTAEFGARDVASRHDQLWLSARLCSLMDEVVQSAGTLSCSPRYAVAAGMITSAQGVSEVPHVEAPASADDIAGGIRVVKLMHRPDIALILIPGVRTGNREVAPKDIATTDLMRGEETLCVGLLESGTLKRNMSLLNLGSHWKWISVDDDGRISRSRTTLTGEMIHTVQSNTLLAASVCTGKPNAFDIEWLQSGFREAKAEGIGRALFCVRLLDYQGLGTSEQRLSYLYGAFLEGEVEFAKRFLHERGEQVLISGSSPLARIWQEYLQEASIPAIIIEDEVSQTAYLNGLYLLAKKSGLLI